MRRRSCLPLLLVLTVSAVHAENFSFASLEALVRAHDAGTVEELLAALPEAQRRDYALMFDSRSLQAASFENPRVILYGPDARFVLTFNGSAAQGGFRLLETLEFDAAAREFRLRELEFPERPGGAAGVRVSETNPERCMRCHGNPPRPLWDSFPLWPGAYGERYGASLSDRERAGLARFLAQQPAHPRYRYLDAARYADSRTFRPGAGGQYAATVREPPNAELAADLAELQSQAVAARLTRQPAFAAWRFALLGVADGGCTPLSDFYPGALWRAERDAFERFARDTARANALEAERKAERAAVHMKALPAPAATDTLLPLRFVAESALGVPTGAWTLALEAGTYDFTGPPAAASPLRASLLEAIAPGDRVLEPISHSVTSADGDRYCSYLKRRSRAALAAAGQTVTSTVARAPAAALAGTEPSADSAPGAAPAALQTCVGCHETDVGPRIPFSDPEFLAQRLGARAAHGTLYDEIRFRLSAGAGARRMPLGSNLADADRRALEAYFASLAGSAN